VSLSARCDLTRIEAVGSPFGTAIPLAAFWVASAAWAITAAAMIVAERTRARVDS
jgi:hypothetical protein